ncbi:MAG TPA: hypothetical protein VKD19_11845 [Pseudolabrys sp.]|nr:hypothetical protein [Pseudolabrys sp.]
MRYQHKKKRNQFRHALLISLPVISHVAVILGTMMMVLDAVHHW